MKSFNVTSGGIILSDPSIEISSWVQANISNVKNGVWECDIIRKEPHSDKISMLYAYNVEAAIDNPEIMQQIMFNEGRLLPFNIQVHEGTFGFFDHDNYGNSSGERLSLCRELTNSKNEWGVLPYGVVARAGFGNTSQYTAKGIKLLEGQYVAFSIEFIKEVIRDSEDLIDDEDEEEDELFED